MKNETKELMRIFERLEVLASGRAQDGDYQRNRLIGVIMAELDDMSEQSRKVVAEQVKVILSAIASDEIYGYYLSELRKRAR